ncbi:MPT63 family protein [Mycolicibacterium wolinskyi]|nr:MPT63 family protein [Mycolicibacterium wolinskyi]MCV7297214.1 MPT63 family protein [Mycolicibacterium goodii]
MGAMLMFAVLAVLSAPNAAAASDPCPHRFGAPQRLTEANGAAVTQWSVSGLGVSTDQLAGYAPAGRLWEADATVEAVTGTVTPIIPNMYAVSRSGERYQVLWQVAAPQTVAPTTLSQGQHSSGKLYFDVTGNDPMAVIYASGGSAPAMMWCCNGQMPMPMPMPGGMSMGDGSCCAGSQPCPCCAGMCP